jgi:hypothetical protein
VNINSNVKQIVCTIVSDIILLTILVMVFGWYALALLSVSATTTAGRHYYDQRFSRSLVS